MSCARTPEGPGYNDLEGTEGSSNIEQLFKLPSSSPARENLSILEASLKRILMTTGFVSVTGHHNQRDEETKTQNQTDSWFFEEISNLTSAYQNIQKKCKLIKLEMKRAC